MSGIQSRGEGPKAEHKNHRHMISERQLEELESCLEDIELHSVDLRRSRSKRHGHQSDHAPLQTIYMFYREYPSPVRAYIGQSMFGRDRIIGQIKNRKWATHVISLELWGYLYPETIRLLETSILRRSTKTFPGVIWHNEQGLMVRFPDPLTRMLAYPALDTLVLKILNVFGRELPDAALYPIPEYPITHTICGPADEYLGKLSHRGRCVFLLKGSRMSSRAANITALRRIGGTGLKYGNMLHYSGRLERKRGTSVRPPGLTITEPVKFSDQKEAARFLTLDGPSLIWEKA